LTQSHLAALNMAVNNCISFKNQVLFREILMSIQR
jgi:hypothetical protein